MKRIVRMNQMFLRRVGLSVGLGLLFLCLCIAPAMAERVVLPESLTEIADEAFLNNASITSVEIPFGAERIGARAFAGCGNLDMIKIPDSVTFIGEEAFAGCGHLYIECSLGSPAAIYAQEQGIPFGEYINTEIPDGLQYEVYDQYAAITGYSGSDREIIIPDQIEGVPVTEIGSNAFDHNNGIERVVLSDNVTTIGSYAFRYSALKDIQWGSGIQNLGEGAFLCSNLEKIVIPGTIKEIAPSAFWDCHYLTDLTILDGVTTIGHYAFSNTKIAEVAFPDSIHTLGSRSFSSCDNLTHVTTPLNWSAVTAEDEWNIYSPFDGCSNLTEITVPNGAAMLPNAAFNGCRALVNIDLPDSLTFIGQDTFSACYKLTQIDLPEKLLFIDNSAFYHSGIEEIEIPDSVETIAYGAFYLCSNLKKVKTSVNWYSTESSDGWVGSPFEACANLKEVIVPDGATVLPQDAFSDCESIEEIHLPDSLECIESRAFYNCKQLTRLDIPDRVSEIWNDAFSGSGLVSIDLPDALSHVTGFDECTNLVNVSLPANLTSISSRAFYNCTSLQRISIPDSVYSIGGEAFGGCSSLMEVNYPIAWDNLYSWTNNIKYPFNACTNLTTVQVTDGTTHISPYAFGNTGLTDIYLPPSVTSVGEEAFAECPDTLTIYGVSGSYAETYAAENGLSFIPGRIPTADYGDTDAVFTITVLAPDGTPVDRATVQAYASDNDMLVGSAVTDESGVCSISGLQKGRLYYFVCRKAPFSFADTYESTDTQSASVTIRANPMNEAYALASPTSATIDAEGGSAEFAVSASGAWTVSCDADWLTLSTAGGSDGALLTVTAAANTGYLRAAEVLLNTENVTTAFYVYQTGDLGVRLPDPVITSPAENDMILPYGDVTISWDPVEGAEEYAVSLRDLDTDTLMLFHESQKDATSVTFPAGYLNGDCRYRVAVAAVPAGATTKDSVTSWRERTFAVSAQEVPGTSSLSGYVYELITPEAVAAYAVRTSSISSDTKDAVVRAAASADGLDTSPLANVTVTVMTEVDQTIVGTATTDAEGYWIMPELTPGESYRIELKKDGFAFRVAYFRYDTVPGENAVKPIYAYDENMDYEGAIGTLLISYDDQLKMNGSIREHGLFAEYFQYSNSKKFVAAEKRNEGIVDNIDFSWKGDVNDDVSGVSYRELKVYDFEDEGKGTHKEIIDYVPQKFSARFNGYLMVRDPEAYAGMTWYKFRVRGDDGVRLIMRTDDYTQLPGKYEDWGNGSNNIATAEPEGMLYVNQVLSVTIEYYNHEGWFDKSNLIFEYSKDYGVSDKDSTWYTVPTDWLYCGNRTVEVSDVAGANYALRLLEANKKIADYSKTTIQDFVELIADEMIGGKVIDMYSELNGSGKLAGSYLATILNNINETIGDEVAEAVYEAVGMGVAGTMTEETMWQQIWTNVCGIGGDLVEDWFDPGMSQGIDNMNNLVKLTAYLKNLKNQDDLLDRIWGAVQNIPEFNTDNMGEISRDNIFLALIVGESKEDNIFSDAVYESVKSANKEIKSILDLCEKGNELLEFVGGLDQSNEARAMLYLMDLESKGTEYNGWIMNLFDSALSLAEEDLGDTFWKTFNRDTIKADLRNLNSIPNKNITRLLARIRGVDLTQTLYKEVLLMTMDATRSYYTTMFKGLIKN